MSALVASSVFCFVVVAASTHVARPLGVGASIDLGLKLGPCTLAGYAMQYAECFKVGFLVPWRLSEGLEQIFGTSSRLQPVPEKIVNRILGKDLLF